MGKWLLYQSSADARILRFLHRNLSTGEVFDCGNLDGVNTPELMILQWIVDQEAFRPGDLIIMPSGPLMVGQEARA